MGSEFIQLTGEDGLAFEYNKRGGVGCISVTANVAPKLCSEMQSLSTSGDQDKISQAEKIDASLQPLHKSLFIESNPSPVKYAAKLLNLCDDAVRLPLVKIMDTTKQEVKNCLLYTSDAADDLTRVDLGGRRIIKKKNDETNNLQTERFFFSSRRRHTRFALVSWARRCV